MYEYLLPIGSVIKLKGASRDLMIFGLLQKHPSLPERQFDYIGVPYPEGYFDVRLQIAFNHEQIENILFRGFEDDKHHSFMNSIEIMSEIQKAKDEQGKTKQ